jgi:WD40-like Beta Propeller Repeat
MPLAGGRWRSLHSRGQYPFSDFSNKLPNSYWWSRDGRYLVIEPGFGLPSDPMFFDRRLPFPSSSQIAVSPQGSIAGVRRGHVEITSLDGARRKDFGAGYGPTWSPDGSWIYFVKGIRVGTFRFRMQYRDTYVVAHGGSLPDRPPSSLDNDPVPELYCDHRSGPT